jgi:hypothetical protein
VVGAGGDGLADLSVAEVEDREVDCHVALLRIVDGERYERPGEHRSSHLRDLMGIRT